MTHWAAKYVGLPWESGARGPLAYDCWGLVWAIQREVFGRELPCYPVTPTPVAVDPEFLRKVQSIREGLADWVLTPQPSRDGDIIMMNSGLHSGVYTSSDGGLVIHSRRSFTPGVRGLSTAQPLSSLRRVCCCRDMEIYTYNGLRTPEVQPVQPPGD